MKVCYINPTATELKSGPVGSWALEAHRFAVDGPYGGQVVLLGREAGSVRAAKVLRKIAGGGRDWLARFGRALAEACVALGCVPAMRHTDAIFVLSPPAMAMLAWASLLGLLPRTRLIGVEFRPASRRAFGLDQFWRLTYRRLSCLVVVSRGQVMAYTQRYPWLNTRFLVSGVDTDFWHRVDSRVESALPTGSILCVGDAGRDDELLWELAGRLSRPVVRVPRDPSVAQQMNDRLRTDRARRVDMRVCLRMPAEQLRTFYSSAASVFLPRRQVGEPYGQTVALEALACGCPVVVNQRTTFEGFLDAEQPFVRLIEPGLEAAVKFFTSAAVPCVRLAALRQHMVATRSLSAKWAAMLRLAESLATPVADSECLEGGMGQ